MTFEEKKQKAQEVILEMYRDFYEDGKSDQEILATNPNEEYDADPYPLYEDIVNTFLGMDADHQSWTTVQSLVDQIAERWDGEDINEDWMDDVIPG